jgi:hypothetical protein
MASKIFINGREYENLEATPPDARRLYEETVRGLVPHLPDADGNGVPDVLEAQGPAAQRTIIENKIIVNGRVYQSPEQMPADVRRLYESALGRGADPGISFQRGGFRLSFSVAKAAKANHGTGTANSAPAPIAPATSEIGIRTLLLVAGLIIGGIVLWILRR